MWSYYGSKSKIVDLYPPPKFKRIIEPFAGSARYSLKYWENDVLLLDKYDVVVRLWKWLQICSKNDILKLPRLKQGDKLSDFSLSEEETLFMGFLTAQGLAKPQNTAVFRATTHRPNWINYSLKNMASNLHKIKHWTIQEGTYDEIPNFPDATWFIDPPYKNGGEYYKFSSKELDFVHLGNWCMNRTGQVIVCENTKADWMPFKPLRAMKGSKHKTVEAIWSNHITNYDNEQMSLFGGV